MHVLKSTVRQRLHRFRLTSRFPLQVVDMVGPASDSLRKLLEVEGPGSFDFAFLGKMSSCITGGEGCQQLSVELDTRGTAR